MSRSSGLVRILTLHCDAASLLSSRELDESLPRLDQWALLCHVLVCKSCRRFRRQLRVIRQAVRNREQFFAEFDSPQDGLSAEARFRIARACQEFSRQDGEPETPGE